MVQQVSFSLPSYNRGFHLITREIVKQLPDLPETGLCNIFIQHTSCALCINENADPTVRSDFRAFVDRMVPDNASYFKHTLEGADDMPAHIKSSLFGQSITIPIRAKRLALGTWQGVYLCEFRDYGGNRNIIISVFS